MFGRKIATGCLSAVVALAIAAPHAGIRWNHTPSMPIGAWLERPRPFPDAYLAGEIVEVCSALEAWERAYLAPGGCPTGLEPMLKPIAAVAGDQVAMGPSGVTVNGATVPNSAPLAHDLSGRLLHPYPAGAYDVAPGQVWLMAPRTDSLDSRYLGPVATADIRALVTPLWVSR